jgi:hypothetical protein
MNHLQETYGDPLFIPVEGPSREGGWRLLDYGGSFDTNYIILKNVKNLKKNFFFQGKENRR